MAATLTQGSTLTTSRVSISLQSQCRQERSGHLSASVGRRKHVSSLGSLQVLAKKAALPRYQGLRKDGLPPSSNFVIQVVRYGSEWHGRREVRAAALSSAKPVSTEPIQVSTFCLLSAFHFGYGMCLQQVCHRPLLLPDTYRKTGAVTGHCCFLMLGIWVCKSSLGR